MSMSADVMGCPSLHFMPGLSTRLIVMSLSVAVHDFSSWDVIWLLPL